MGILISNNFLTGLLLTLVNLVEKNGSIPRKLMLQFDNCVRENKNKYVMAFMAWLVEADFFIEVSYRHSL